MVEILSRAYIPKSRPWGFYEVLADKPEVSISRDSPPKADQPEAGILGMLLKVVALKTFFLIFLVVVVAVEEKKEVRIFKWTWK